jgi:hypothetical protein
MLKRILLCLVLLNVIVLIGYGIVSYSNSRAEERARKAEIAKVGKGIEKENIMSKQEYVSIQEKIEASIKSGTISDTDLDWAIALMHNRPNRFAHSIVMNLFLKLKQIPSTQRDRIYNATIECLNSKDKDDKYKLNQLYASNVLKSLKDKRAIPQLLPLLSDPQPKVKLRAQEALLAMGYAEKR